MLNNYSKKVVLELIKEDKTINSFHTIKVCFFYFFDRIIIKKAEYEKTITIWTE